MKQFLILATVATLALAGCAPAEPPVDIEAEKAGLLAADAEWSAAAEAKNLEKFLSFYTEDARLLFPNNPPVTDKQVVREIFSEGFEDPVYDLSWVALKAKVARAGDLGYTTGTYNFTYTGPEGKPVNERGSYVAIWEKQPAGKWKIVIDIYNSDQPAPGAV